MELCPALNDSLKRRIINLQVWMCIERYWPKQGFNHDPRVCKKTILQLDDAAYVSCPIHWFGFGAPTQHSFFLLVSHLRLGQRVDDPIVGWLNHFVVITLYQQLHISYFAIQIFFKTPTPSLTRHLRASGHTTNGEEEALYVRLNVRNPAQFVWCDDIINL